MSRPQIRVASGLTELATLAADIFVGAAKVSIAERGFFCAALAGGSTPRSCYALLAQSPYREAIDWNKVHLFWGDERSVPPDDRESNFGLVNEALLKSIPIPRENVHRMRGELSPDAAAQIYERELTHFFAGKQPVFDLILLGLGTDGHTASLFPGSPVLDESVRWVAAVEHATPPPPLVARVTLTLPVINLSRRVVFMAAGREKADALARILRGREGLPANLVQPEDGELVWLVDRDAIGAGNKR